MATQGIYQQKVTELFKEKSTVISLGLFTLFFIVSAVLISTNQERISVSEIDKANREQFLAQQQLSTKTSPLYTVLEGEGLWQVAEKTTGNGENWTRIATANNITNPLLLEAGTKLTIPQDLLAKVTDIPAPAVSQGVQNVDDGQIDGGMTGKANPVGKEYVVLEGEGLWQIAQKVYGDGNVWVEIAKVNNLDPNNPQAVYPGMKLIMPSL